MNLNIARIDENRSIKLGTVKEVRPGKGSAAGKVVTVVLEGEVYNSDIGKREPQTIDISFWNNDTMKLADRIEKAKVREGSVLTVEVYEKDGKFTGNNFKYKGHWQIPAHDDKKERNIFMGVVASMHEGESSTGMNIPVPKANTQYYGLVAENYGTIDGIFVEAVNINGASAEKGGAMSFGAIAAVNHGIVSFCHATGKIIVNRRDGAVGGLVGINYGSIYDCSFGQLGTQNDNQLRNSGDTGGIVGRNMGGSISKCEIYDTYIGANVDQCGNAFGGIVGYSVGGKITDCGSYEIAMGVTNGTLVSGYYPKMGYVAGHMKDNAVMRNCVVAGCSHSFGKLTVGYRKYCYLGKTGSYGLLQNNSVVYYPET